MASGAEDSVSRLRFHDYRRIEQLYLGLKKIIGLTKLIGTGREIIPLKQEEVDFLMEFGKEKQVVAMSTGIIENGKIRITDGPLKGREALIRKIDRHKRKACLAIPMFGGEFWKHRQDLRS